MNRGQKNKETPVLLVGNYPGFGRLRVRSRWGWFLAPEAKKDKELGGWFQVATESEKKDSAHGTRSMEPRIVGTKQEYKPELTPDRGVEIGQSCPFRRWGP